MLLPRMCSWSALAFTLTTITSLEQVLHTYQLRDSQVILLYPLFHSLAIIYHRRFLQLSVFERLTRRAQDASDWPWYASQLGTRGPATASQSSNTPTTPITRRDASTLLTMASACSSENTLRAPAA